MAKEDIIGLAFRGNSLEWARLSAAREEFQTAAVGSIPFDADLNEEQIEVLAERLRTESGGLKGDIAVGLPSEDMLLRVVDLPLVEGDELSSMVRLQADKFSPFPVDSMVVSHEILEKRGETCVVLIAAVKEEVVDKFGKVVESAGGRASRVDVAVLGRWHLLKNAGSVSEKGRQLFLLLEGSTVEIIVAQDGVPILLRSLGSIESLAEEELAAELAGEVGYTLMSLELEHGSVGECPVNVWHAGTAPEGLAGKLQEECSCEATLSSFDGQPSLAEGVAGRTADKSMAKLDLTPDIWRSATGEKEFRRKMLRATATVLGVWLLGVGVLFGGLRYQEMRLGSLKAKQERLHGPATDIRRLRYRVVTIKRHGDVSASALECLREISLVQPGGVDLTSFNYRKGEAVRIAGEALSPELVYDFNRKLDESELFLDVQLQGPHEIRNKRKVRFEMNIKLRGGEE